MKKYINKLIVSGLLGFGLYACGESFLETRPSDQFSDSSVFTDLESAQTVLVGAYDMFSNGWYAHFLNQDMLFHADIRADDALVSPNPNFNYGRFVASYQYLQVIPTLNNVRDSWLMSYKLIDLCNGLLDNLPNFAESPERDKMEGEARVLRAYVYHFLVRTYAKAVKHFPQSPGVILRTTQGTDDMPRSTVAEVYELMKEDVEKATSLLANSESKIYFDKSGSCRRSSCISRSG